MPDNLVTQALTEDFGRPILVTSVPGWESGEPVDPVLTAERLFVRPAVVLDQGLQTGEPSTVIDFTTDPPELVRQGKGELRCCFEAMLCFRGRPVVSRLRYRNGLSRTTRPGTGRRL